MKSPLLLVLVPIASAALLAVAGSGSRDLARQHSSLFSASGNCATCHSPDAPDQPALRDASGADVSPPSFWRSTMMANAAKDPFWRAKVSAEVSANPTLVAQIEDKCTTCHAPMGRTQAREDGADYYSMADLMEDSLALDGVSCTVCHQIKPDNLGDAGSFSGGFQINRDQVIYGPYDDPVGWPMLAMSGYEPRGGAHMGTSELCATCHTLYTDAVDENGQVVGRLPEQTPYLEWLNSEYPGREVECQTCHMPTTADPIPISNTPRGLSARSPFYKHSFVGGNAFMLGILRDHGDDLGVTAESAHFDSTIARTRRMLASSARLGAGAAWDGDTLQIELTVENLAGHKLPTGYPSRRAWIDLSVRDASGALVFRSGDWDPATGELAGLDDGYEKHHQVIRGWSEVQVYESVMGTPSGAVSYGLLRSSRYLKDNRILPRGWSSGGPADEDIAPAGVAGVDPDYQNGRGTDEVIYRIGLSGGQDYTISAVLRYQSIAPRFAEDLFGHDTEPVAAFRSMYRARPNRPETLDSLTLSVGGSVSVEPEPVLGSFALYPNPTSGPVTVSGARGAVHVYDLLGRLVKSLAGEVHWDLETEGGRLPAGVYVVVDSTRPSASRTLVVAY